MFTLMCVFDFVRTRTTHRQTKTQFLQQPRETTLHNSLYNRYLRVVLETLHATIFAVKTPRPIIYIFFFCLVHLATAKCSNELRIE